MKKLMITALLCLPMALMAQTPAGTAPATQSQGIPAAMGEPTLCVEMVVTDRGGRVGVVIEMGTAPEITWSNDKFVMGKLKMLTTSRFTNTVDALNALTQLGFTVQSSYVVGVGQAATTHVILTRIGRAGRPGEEARSGGDKEVTNTGGAVAPNKRKRK